MNKIKEFFSGLSKSTKITLLSCGCFTALTLLLLLFFVIFPITPSEKIIENFGRENLINEAHKQEEAGTTTVTGMIDSIVTFTTTTKVSTATTTTGTFDINIYTNLGGYLPGGFVQTGDYGVEYYQTYTEPVDPVPEEPSQGPDQQWPYEGYTEEPTLPADVVTTPVQQPTLPSPPEPETKPPHLVTVPPEQKPDLTSPPATESPPAVSPVD